MNSCLQALHQSQRGCLTQILFCCVSYLPLYSGWVCTRTRICCLWTVYQLQWDYAYAADKVLRRVSILFLHFGWIRTPTRINFCLTQSSRCRKNLDFLYCTCRLLVYFVNLCLCASKQFQVYGRTQQRIAFIELDGKLNFLVKPNHRILTFGILILLKLLSKCRRCLPLLVDVYWWPILPLEKAESLVSLNQFFFFVIVHRTLTRSSMHWRKNNQDKAISIDLAVKADWCLQWIKTTVLFEMLEM